MKINIEMRMTSIMKTTPKFKTTTKMKMTSTSTWHVSYTVA